MAYKISISPLTQSEIENAIDYYSLYSADAPKYFILSLKNAYSSLSKNPFYQIRYKNIRAFKLKKFPYSLYFIIDEENKSLKIISCFHDRRNPKKRPK
ncbi:type II toxin-antitoxin system RelE/ParE family toxin [Pedobacter cryophilus]|uniref:Type II toxin-antitoxin system RelE/ParE family toxin n=1 Tax=Pedobacter cryophilus TaxID=2571271 RepID=A0A4U1C1T8_9SPHI|nr:type II toxin-antitoxin system RelE/ParE family toxin [Pedobacter cryophilus]TKB98954.1 type II toxin-antitoxin system RelE/ParE family toxin [Pedobacter cryophilus]